MAKAKGSFEVAEVLTSDPANAEMVRRFNVLPIPRSFLFDGRGRLLDHWMGPRDEPTLSAMLTRHGL